MSSAKPTRAVFMPFSYEKEFGGKTGLSISSRIVNRKNRSVVGYV
jgi:hypothetical protein